MRHISVVTTLYYSVDYVQEFYRRITNVIRQLTPYYEIIFVDDGSPDDSIKLVLDIISHDRNVRLIELSRNFGHHKAILTGLSYAKGDFVFLIDSDLEERPEWLLEFYEKINNNEDIDVVYGCQKVRSGNLFEKIMGNIFYKAINYLSDVEIPKNYMVARLMRKSYLEKLLLFNESDVFLAGLLSLTGFNQIGVPLEKSFKGKSTYTFSKKMSQAIDAIVSFSNKPLLLICFMGFLLALTSFLLMFYFLVNKIIYKTVLLGWSSLIVSIFFIGGLAISSIGVVGIYLAKIFIQVKNRPSAIIKKKYNFNDLNYDQCSEYNLKEKVDVAL